MRACIVIHDMIIEDKAEMNLVFDPVHEVNFFINVTWWNTKST
jgi:hypothetical protein